jgi:hypothetical protein
VATSNTSLPIAFKRKLGNQIKGLEKENLVKLES